MDSDLETEEEGWSIVSKRKKGSCGKKENKAIVRPLLPTPDNSQNWGNDVIIGRRPDYKAKFEKQRAHREGKTIAIAKGNAGQKHNYDAKHMAKVDKETENFHIKRIHKDFSKKMQQARNEKGLTQKDLAQRLHLPVDIIVKYENGTAIPDDEVIQRLKKFLAFS